MSPILSCYESVAQSSMEMLAAARRHDWDAMVEAERRCAGWIEKLRATPEDTDRLGADERSRKSQIIRSVLEHDAEIRRLVDPRMHELERLLSASARQHRIENAYRWVAPGAASA